MELITRHGTDAMTEAYTTLFNCAMVAERQNVLGAAPYERSESRRGYANGFKPKTIDTRVGPLTLAVPKTRGVDFYPSALEKGSDSGASTVIRHRRPWTIGSWTGIYNVRSGRFSQSLPILGRYGTM